MLPIGETPCFIAAINLAKRVAPSNANILISGESGTGKEVFANFIHNNSRRQKELFVALNCSSIPEQLLESELFGHSKGSFTGATDKRIGLFEAASEGTIFLDEIGDLSLSLQAKLLRVLQEKKIKRVGENNERPINCRIISATHKNLAVEVANNRFREDLFFRLNVIPITLPPLRDRKADIPLLAIAFLQRFSIENQLGVKSISYAGMHFLSNYPWKGNVRELENTIERGAILCKSNEICVEDFLLPKDSSSNDTEMEFLPTAEIPTDSFNIKYQRPLFTLDEVVNKYITYAVTKNEGAKDRTAKEIGIDRKTLYKRFFSHEQPINI